MIVEQTASPMPLTFQKGKTILGKTIKKLRLSFVEINFARIPGLSDVSSTLLFEINYFAINGFAFQYVPESL